MKVKIKQIFLIFILFVFIFTITFAEELEDLQDKRSKIKENIEDSNEKMQEIQIEITENLEQLNVLNEKISGYESEIVKLNKDLKNVKKEIKIIEKKLKIVQENYNAQRTALQNRIVSLYESGDILYLDVLLNSASVSDFLSNYYLIGEIARYDQNLLDDIENQKNQIDETKKNLEVKRENVKEVKNNKEKTTIALENARIIRNSYLESLSDQEKETQSKIDEYQAELDRIDSQIVAIATGELNLEYVGGEFAWPVPGYYTITSRFGTRLHPILKVYRTHTGTDIGAPTGAKVIAANDGIVIASSYSSSGYGNMVMIDHGGGIVSLYGHGSKLIAEVRTRS